MPTTARPASESARAVPPVETSSQPAAASVVAKGTSPVLSETLMSARIGAQCLSLGQIETRQTSHDAAYGCQRSKEILDRHTRHMYSRALTLGGPASPLS